MKINTLVSDCKAPWAEYPFVLRAGPWQVGDHVAYTREHIRSGAGNGKWRGVILSCSGNPNTSAGRTNFLVLDRATGEVWYQHPHFLRKLGR